MKPAPLRTVVDRWRMHRLALAWALADDGAAAGGWDARMGDFPLSGPSAAEFLDFLRWHGLISVWLAECQRSGWLERLEPEIAGCLRDEDRLARVQFMVQSLALRQLGQALDGLPLPHLVFKGVALRDELYVQPHVRSATDIDVLVHPADRDAAGRVLESLGFVHTGDFSSAHEETWQRGSVDVDLHWDVLAPGRTRESLVDGLLARKVRSPACWRPCDEDTVMLMLLHPAVTKYVCSPHVGLNRVADLLRLVHQRDIDWVVVSERIRQTGLSAAAWAMLTWVDQLVAGPSASFADSIPQAFRETLRPGPLRAAYLRGWITHDLPGRMVDRADWLVRIGFTLPFHDNLADAFRASSHRLRRTGGLRPEK